MVISPLNYLILNKGSYHDQWTKGQNDQGQLPSVHEANDHPDDEGRHPLEEDPHLVCYPHLDLIHISRITVLKVLNV